MFAIGYEINFSFLYVFYLTFVSQCCIFETWIMYKGHDNCDPFKLLASCAHLFL